MSLLPKISDIYKCIYPHYKATYGTSPQAALPAISKHSLVAIKREVRVIPLVHPLRSFSSGGTVGKTPSGTACCLALIHTKPQGGLGDEASISHSRTRYFSHRFGAWAAEIGIPKHNASVPITANVDLLANSHWVLQTNIYYKDRYPLFRLVSPLTPSLKR